MEYDQARPNSNVTCVLTQSPVFPIFDAHVAKIGDPELFNLAASAVPTNASMETDLFTGIQDES